MATISNFFVHPKHHSLRNTISVVLLGQLVSFIMAIIGFSSSYLAKLVIKAFQFTSITSVTLFDCWTIPWVMVLTYFFIGTRYSIRQYFGVATCILGLGLVLLSDAGIGGGGGSKPLLGDVFVILGTLFYALSNVGEEYCVKQKDLVEVISMIGVFGLVVSICEMYPLCTNFYLFASQNLSIISAVYFIVSRALAVARSMSLSVANYFSVERHTLMSIEWSSDVILGFAGYATATLLFYTLVPFLLKLSGATLFNLSALTSDMWAVLIRILFYHEEVGRLYYVSFAIVAVGLVIYSISEKNTTEESNVDGHLRDEYQALAVECAETGGQTHVA
ncbi:hypothetical protein KSS87_003809 [Heliosperma pusillum]|nr:hypothetical protein KSS87_003809 [Heliosperma pusillum]